jgi:hypothetical protein
MVCESCPLLKLGAPVAGGKATVAPPDARAETEWRGDDANRELSFPGA